MSSVLNGSGIRTESAERSLGQLLADATRDLSGLVRDELDLAKAELKDDVKAGVAGGAMFGLAAFLGLVAVVLLSVAAAYGLTALGLHPAWAFLIVAGAFLLVAGISVMLGLRKVKQVKAPERAIATTRESVAVLKGGTSALR